jgi:TonB family protein
MLHKVKKTWYKLIPDSARAPILKKGKVRIEFVILKDGKITGMRLVSTSGDVALDRGAWGGITASKFPPLPKEFAGQYLAVRFAFYYNPEKSDFDKPASAIIVSPASVQLSTGAQKQFSATIPNAKDSAVIWTLLCAAAGACGSISAEGVYTAPLNAPNHTTVTVMATLASDPGNTGSAMVTIQPSPTQ